MVLTRGPHRVTGLLGYEPTDTSKEATAWRADPFVKLAYERLRRPLVPYRHANRQILLEPGNLSSVVSLADMGRTFELALGDMGIAPRQASTPNGVAWFGVGMR